MQKCAHLIHNLTHITVSICQIGLVAHMGVKRNTKCNRYLLLMIAKVIVHGWRSVFITVRTDRYSSQH